MFQLMKYFDVYVLCQAANRLLDGGFELNINDYFEPLFETDDIINEFNKHSLLHSYCEWVIQQNVWDEEENIVELIRSEYKYRHFSHGKGVLWIDHAINHYCQAGFDFIEWAETEYSKKMDQMSDVEIDDLRYDYLSNIQLGEEYDSCMIQLSNEMFYVLFQNREFLYKFNNYLATYNHNRPERISIPKWVQRAVFFRDRGCCVFCGKDLSGTVHITENKEIHYDHIVPLCDNGLNDVSNLQLACQECNLRKSGKGMTSNQYQQWYDMDTE